MSQAEIGNLRVRMGLDTAEFNSGVRNVQGSIAGLSSTLKGFATAAAAMTVFNATVSAVKAVAEIGDVAESIGVTAEQLQVYQQMALASGTSTDVLTRGLQTLAEQSVQSGSALEKLFTENGMTLAGKDTNQIIREFTDLVRNARTPAEQLAIITDVLGTKVGRQLVEAFRSGASGIDEATKAMVESGNYHTNAEVQRLQEIETKYNEVTHNIGVVWQQMVVGLIEKGETFWTWLSQTNQAMVNQMGAPEVGAKLAELQAQLAQKRADAEGLSGRAKVAIDAEIQRLQGLVALYEKAAKTANIPSIKSEGGRGDLAGNIDPNTYKLTPPTKRPEKDSGKETKSKSIFPQIPPNTIDDIYGYGEAVNSLKERLTETTPEAGFFSDALQRISGTIQGGLSEALSGLISGTMSVQDAFASMAQSIIQTMSDLAAQLITSGILKMLLGALGGGGGAGLNIGGMMFGGVYANGGYLGSGKWGIAGEAGPEIIHGPARITPMDKVGSGNGVNVTVINNTPARVNTRQGSDGGLTIEVVEEAVATAISRGGNKIDSAMQRGFGLRRAGR